MKLDAEVTKCKWILCHPVETESFSFSCERLGGSLCSGEPSVLFSIRASADMALLLLGGVFHESVPHSAAALPSPPFRG